MAMDDGREVADLYREESERVLLFLTRRTWDAEVSLELTAETFALAIGSWRRLRRLTVEQQRAWLFTVARRQLSRYVRRATVERRAVRRLGMQLPRVSADEAAEIERRAGLAELRGLLAPELARLDSGQREALRLRVVEERPYEEVARLLGVSEQAARARVSRALRRLCDALEHHRDGADGLDLPRRCPAPQGGSS
jgi:RNA polymerase sigma-70 factor, ECF subfamily